MRNALPFSVAFLTATALSAIAGDQQRTPTTASTRPASKTGADRSKYELRYKFQKGQTLRWKVTHLATTETTVRGTTQTSKSRSVSTKAWHVTDVADDGKMTFVHQIEDVDMWQKVSDRPEVRYNSKTDKKPPLIYEKVAETVGVPMFVVTIDPLGHIIKQEDKRPHAEGPQLGLEQLTIPLPKEPVKVGDSWQWPSEIAIPVPDGLVKRIKVRRSYTLKKVQTGLATIAVETQVLTPVHDPKVKVNLIQRLNDGTVKFDIDAGRVVFKQLDWDETVVGFEGADSMMQYVARFTEELLPDEAETSDTTSEQTAAAASQPVKPRDGKPLFRR